jgi:flagellar hook-length control protein FliK
MHMTNYGDNTVPEPNSVSFIPNGVTVDGSADISNIGLKQTESVATSTQVSSPTVETILSGRSKQLGISANLSNSNSIGQQTFVEAEVDDSTNWQNTTKLPFVDMEIDPARGNRLGTQSDQVSNMLLGGSHASVVPMPTVNGSKKAIEPTLLTGTAIDHQIDNSILGQSFNSETAFSQSDDNSSSLMESELASTESDSFTTVLEQENETQRMEFLSTAPQRQLNETGGVSLQDEVSSQFAEVRRVREARQDIIREIQSLQNDHRQESEREMTIQLQPARLGRLMVRVSQRRDLDGNSAVAVQIQASSTEAQQLLMNELSDLRSDFQTQGIDLTGLDVSIDSGRNFHQSRSQGLFFADYQRQMRSGGNIRPADPVNSSIQRSTSNRARVGTQYANNQLNLVI